MNPQAAKMPQRARQFLDFLVCGIPTHKREGRLMAVFGAFVDDSGSHAQSPIMVLVGLVAKHEDWRRFTDEWYDALTSGKLLKPHKGSIYFKSTEAERCSHCFDGFSRAEADEKVNLLADITLKHISYGMVVAIRWDHFRDKVQGEIVKPKGRLIKAAQHPYDLCFHALTASILNEQIQRESHEEIDFAFDQQSSALLRCINWYNEYRKKVPKHLREIMGQIIPGNDKTLLPLQAADLIAWQTRNGSWPYAGRKTDIVRKIAESRKIYKRPISKQELTEFVTGLNDTSSIMSLLRAVGVDITTDQVIEILAKAAKQEEVGAEADISETEKDD